MVVSKYFSTGITNVAGFSKLCWCSAYLMTNQRLFLANNCGNRKRRYAVRSVLNFSWMYRYPHSLKCLFCLWCPTTPAQVSNTSRNLNAQSSVGLMNASTRLTIKLQFHMVHYCSIPCIQEKLPSHQYNTKPIGHCANSFSLLLSHC